MYLSKKKVILVISISVLVFFFTYTDIKSQDIKITDGDTIKINGDKIRFSGIDTPELKGKKANPIPAKLAREFLNDLVAKKEVSIRRITKDRYRINFWR